MQTLNRFRCFLLLAALACSCDREQGTAAPSADAPTTGPAIMPASGADWPAFHDGGPLRGLAAPIGPPPMRVRWIFKATDDVPANAAPSTGPTTQGLGAPPAFEASAAIVGETVYAGDRAGGLHAIDLKTGHQRWVYTSEAGFAASPAVVNGLVCVGDEDGTFHAINAATGKKAWTFDANGDIHSSTNFAGGRIVFGNDGADIYCLRTADGKKLWDAKAGDRVNGAPAIGDAAPGGGPVVYVSGCDAQLRGIDLDTGRELFAHDLGALCPGSPAVLDDRLVVGTDSGRVVCLSLDGQRKLWTFEGIESQAMVYASPAVADGVVVVGARDRNVYGIDLATGAKKWSFPTRGDVDSSAVLSGGRVYVGSKDKHFYVLDLKTGRKLWDFVASRAITATAAIGQGAVVVGDTGGRLYCFEPE